KASARVQVRVASVHDQPVPEIAVAVKPVGSVSATVTVPLVAPVPELVAVSVYVSPLSPWMKFPVCDLAIVMSATWLMVVGSLVESLLVTTSPPPDTAAEFVTELEAVADTFTVTVIAGYELPAAKASERVQVSVANVQDHPVPEI